MLLMRADGAKPAIDGMGCHIYNYGGPPSCGGSPCAGCFFQRQCLQVRARLALLHPTTPRGLAKVATRC